jgi:cAMP phosphodiesterase
MKFQLLPSTFDENGCASPRQHLSCFIIDDCVALDAGSLAMATSARQKQIRDVVLTHAHLDHIAGLPLFIDDLFAVLEEPIRVYATKEVIEILERDIFNWDVYPSFAHLKNEKVAVLEYCPFEFETEFRVKHLSVKPIEVNHKIQSVGFLIGDGHSKIAVSGDTAEMSRFWELVNREKSLSAVLVECAFPDELADLASISHHLTPSALKRELNKLKRSDCPVYVINMKPTYREQIVRQIKDLSFNDLRILEVGGVYEW